MPENPALEASIAAHVMAVIAVAAEEHAEASEKQRWSTLKYETAIFDQLELKLNCMTISKISLPYLKNLCNKGISALSLALGEITDEAVDGLLEVLQTNQLVNFSIGNVKLSETALKKILRVLENKNLNQLEIDGYPIPGFLAEIISLLKTLPGLKHVHLTNSGITDGILLNLLQILTEHKVFSLEGLDLKYNLLTSAVMPQLNSYLKYCEKLIILSLEGNGIDNRGVFDLNQLLLEKSSLSVVLLDKNPLNPSELKPLTLHPALQKTLPRLTLAEIQVGDLLFCYSAGYSGHVMICSQASADLKKIRVVHSIGRGFKESHLPFGNDEPSYAIFRLKDKSMIAKVLQIIPHWLSWSPPYDWEKNTLQSTLMQIRGHMQLETEAELLDLLRHPQDLEFAALRCLDYCQSEFNNGIGLLNVVKHTARYKSALPPFLPVKSSEPQDPDQSPRGRGAVCNSAILNILQTAYTLNLVKPAPLSIAPEGLRWISNKKLGKIHPLNLIDDENIVAGLKKMKLALPEGLRLHAEISYPLMMYYAFLNDATHFEYLGLVLSPPVGASLTEEERKSYQAATKQIVEDIKNRKLAFLAKLTPPKEKVSLAAEAPKPKSIRSHL